SAYDSSKSASVVVTVSNGNVRIVPGRMNFGKRTTSRWPYVQPAHPQYATLTNTGSSALTIDSIAIVGTDVSAFNVTSECGSTLDAGSSCTFHVQFQSRVVGSYTAAVEIVDSSADSPQRVNLSGVIGATVATSVSAAMHDGWTVAAPRPMGESAVGTRVVRLVDSQRDDPYRANGTKRELMVRFWYPTPSDAACVPADYASPAAWSYESQLIRIAPPHVTTNSCLNAPVAPGSHPVVVFTHGFTGTFTDYTYLFEDLASRGYVVVSVDHTYDATIVEFPDGRLAKSVFGSHLTQYIRSDEEALTLAVSIRLDDLNFVLNDLPRLNGAAGGDFAARLDLSRIAIGGHSLGGLTTLLAAEHDHRVKAGFALDVALPDHLGNVISTPMLLLSAGRASWNVDDCHTWDALRGPRLALDLPGADHLAVTDAVWLLPNNALTGSATSTQTIAAVRSYVAGFLDTHLAGKGSQLSLTRASTAFPGVFLASSDRAQCGSAR
ncbi:MAG: choice-of-anchor D domain-containing protein, partial [Steroidobacterales bacterium]